jgi:hypothetical protein
MASSGAETGARIMPSVDFNLAERFSGKSETEAKSCLQSWDFGRLFRLDDGQLVALARLMCRGDYAKTWAALLPTNTTWQTFQLLFCKEFCEENVDRLHEKLLKMKQETLVGEYATRLRRTLLVVLLPVEEQIRHFLRGLKPELFIVACAAGPKTLEEAIEAARQAERAYVPVREERVAVPCATWLLPILIGSGGTLFPP